MVLDYSGSLLTSGSKHYVRSLKGNFYCIKDLQCNILFLLKMLCLYHVVPGWVTGTFVWEIVVLPLSKPQSCLGTILWLRKLVFQHSHLSFHTKESIAWHGNTIFVTETFCLIALKQFERAFIRQFDYYKSMQNLTEELASFTNIFITIFLN